MLGCASARARAALTSTCVRLMVTKRHAQTLRMATAERAHGIWYCMCHEVPLSCNEPRGDSSAT